MVEEDFIFLCKGNNKLLHHVYLLGNQVTG